MESQRFQKPELCIPHTEQAWHQAEPWQSIWANQEKGYIRQSTRQRINSMKKILFLHGFFATGSCPMARALKEAFDGQAVVLTPDLPLHPKEALKYIRMLIDKEKPDLLIGNSCGAFLAQMLSPVVGIPARSEEHTSELQSPDHL